VATPASSARQTEPAEEEEEAEASPAEVEEVAESNEKEEKPLPTSSSSTQTESANTPEAIREETPSTKQETKKPAFDSNKVLPEIPNYAQYLIVGGGTAAMSAFKAIRANDPQARVLVITAEQYKPYMRPPLSKELWTSAADQSLLEQLKFKQYNGSERSLYFLDDEFYASPKFLNELEHGGVAVVTGRRVTKVDVQAKTVRLDNNWEITYDKCLLATGGQPRNLPAVETNWESLKDKVTLFRGVDDFKRLYEIAKQPGKTIAVVGGGFLGSELACALGQLSKKTGSQVVQLFPETGILRRVLPEYLSEWTTQRVRDENVSVVANVNVDSVQMNDNKVELKLSAGVDKKSAPRSSWLLADHIVVAVGLEPNVELAQQAGFEVDQKLGGYVVNAELQARNSVWVAGDAACFYDVRLGRRRVEHHDHAVVSGRLAGENMTGAGKPYWHQSMFWSDLGPRVGFEAIGLVDSSLQTVGLFAKADGKDTPAAQVSETNETLRSEVKDSSVSIFISHKKH
jgi:programmed cell death 8 (apoptosis-inducing factor)